jgi:hypothetical protein
MALNVTTTIEALSSMNFTANCATSTRWLEAQGSLVSQPDDSINVDLLRAALPTDFNSLSNQTLSDLYSQLTISKPSLWYEPTVESIQAGCLAPKLATVLSFGELDLTANCSATAAFYSNRLCAVNGPQSGWTVDKLGNSKWIVGDAFSNPLNSSLGLAMLRSAVRNQYHNVSEVELATWASLTIGQTSDFTNKSQVAQICKVCLREFCEDASFTGNPDIAGIGVSSNNSNALRTQPLTFL